MGVKTALAELNAALKLITSHIPNVYLIHKDLIIATKDIEEQSEATREVMEVIKSKNLTLNSNKCTFGTKEINFGECYFPKPQKLKVLEDLQPPKNNEELKSFIWLMQSNCDFILYSQT